MLQFHDSDILLFNPWIPLLYSLLFVRRSIMGIHPNKTG